VSDGFDFGPPKERREARTFEPPPWERAQFDELARQKEAERQAEQEAAAQQAADSLAAAHAEAELIVLPEPVVVEATATVIAEAASAAVRFEAAPKQPLDDKKIAALMLELRAEEPRSLEGLWAVSVGAGTITAVIGVAVFVWGVFALGKPGIGTAGTFVGLVMLAFGVAFLGIGGWMIFRGLRQRGVL
jgi:hypothetical protein